jgi:alanine-glyoxylate transaminase/serine-glyoxylate transaminase/serine-pyruvate transaminase
MSSQNPVFIPGPTNMPGVGPQGLRHADAGPPLARLRTDVQAGGGRGAAGAEDERGRGVILIPSTGTGGWEAAISNTLSPGDTVLAARFGMFSHRWIDMCQRHRLDVEMIETPWGRARRLAAIERALKADRNHQIKAVLATHNETATGVKSDIAGIRRAMDAAGHPACCSSMGCRRSPRCRSSFTAWGVDIAVAGSQKGFMLPAGLAILGVSPKAIAAMETARLPRTFFDFKDMLAAYARGGYPYTPAVGLIAGLAHAIDLLEDRGLDNVYARHHRLPKACAARLLPGA